MNDSLAHKIAHLVEDTCHKRCGPHGSRVFGWVLYDHRDPNPYPGPSGLGLPMSNTTVRADRDIADNEESPVVW